MSKGRLEAFSDGVLAILITIMVLELKVPQGTDLVALRNLQFQFLPATRLALYLSAFIGTIITTFFRQFIK